MATSEGPSAEYATAEDLKRHWPDAPEGEDVALRQKLFEAELEVLALYPDITERIASKTLRPEVVTLVLCRMAKRALQPLHQGMENVQSFNQGAGPFSQSVTFTGTDGAMYLTKTERRLLTSGRESGTAFTIHPVARTHGRPPRF